MGQSAQLPLTAADLLPPTIAPAPPGAAVPPQAAGMMAGPGGTPLGTPAGPQAPQDPPWDVQRQPDGSALFLSRTNPPVVIGLAPAPKLPVSMQPKAL